MGESAVLFIICKIYLYILRYLYFHVFVKLNRTLSALIIYIYIYIKLPFVLFKYTSSMWKQDMPNF